jgi:hypothetical protein
VALQLWKRAVSQPNQSTIETGCWEPCNIPTIDTVRFTKIEPLDLDIQFAPRLTDASGFEEALRPTTTAPTNSGFNTEIMMRIWTSAIYATALVATSSLAQPARPGPPANPPVAGIIRSFDGKTVTIKLNDGSVGSASLASNVTITFNAKRTLADIKPGDFIASGGTRGPDGKIQANEIRIFSGVRGEGQFPMAKPDQVMTNATVKEVMTDATVKQVGSVAGVPIIKLTFHGSGAPGTADCTGRSSDASGGAGTGCVGETEFEVPANTPVVASLPGDVSMLKPGAKVSINVIQAPDGSMSATRITISE